MRTIEPSTKGPDDGSGGAGGAEALLLLGTSDEGSLGGTLLEARGVGVEVFLLGVAILGFLSAPQRLPFPPTRVPAPLRPAPARSARRATLPESPPRACVVPAGRRQWSHPLGGLRVGERGWVGLGGAEYGCGTSFSVHSCSFQGLFFLTYTKISITALLTLRGNGYARGRREAFAVTPGSLGRVEDPGPGGRKRATCDQLCADST